MSEDKVNIYVPRAQDPVYWVLMDMLKKQFKKYKY